MDFEPDPEATLVRTGQSVRIPAEAIRHPEFPAQDVAEWAQNLPPVQFVAQDGAQVPRSMTLNNLLLIL